MLEPTRFQSPEHPPAALQNHPLPPLAVKNFGTRLVQRAASLIFLLMCLLLVSAFLVAGLVEINLTIDAPGTLEPIGIWTVRSQETGIISEILVGTGATVHKGQPLVRLDSFALRTQLEQLQADYADLEVAYQQAKARSKLDEESLNNALRRAQANLLNARATLRNQAAMFGIGANIDSVLNVYAEGSHVGFDYALADFKAASADVDEVELDRQKLRLAPLELRRQGLALEKLAGQINATRKRLSLLTVPAPADGIILTDELENKVGSIARAGEVLLEVAQPNAWQVRLYVHERDIYKVNVGARTTLEIQAFRTSDNDLFSGTVTSIAAESLERSEGRAPRPRFYRVTVMLDPRDVRNVGRDRLKRGYSVDGKIITHSGRIVQLLYQYVYQHLSL